MADTVLVTGAGGQLGRAVTARFERSEWTVVALDRAGLDITDAAAVDATVARVSPTYVVNAAAYTAVDAAESDEAAAHAVNADGVGNLVEACAAVGARLCHLSTDYVFDGTKVGPYVESDTRNPRSAYGRSKLAGESELRADDLLVRTSWLFGVDGPDMVHTILRLAAADGPLRFVDDQVGCPTSAPDLADVLFRLVDEGRAGAFHVTNAGPVSWYEFAREVLAAAGHDPDRVVPIRGVELQPPRAAGRPANSVLDGLALRLCDLPPLRHHREALQEIVDQIAGQTTGGDATP